LARRAAGDHRRAAAVEAARMTTAGDIRPVSVVIAARNSERTILSGAVSILEQDYPNLELIVVDDASTDGTTRVLTTHPALASARVIALDRRVGRSAARNLGIAAAQHDAIAIMDADDFALPHRLSAGMQMLADRPEVAGVGGQAVGLHNARLWRFGVGKTEPSDIAAALSAFQMPLVHPSMLIRKDVFTQVGGYREDLDFCEDLDLFARASEAFAFAAAPDVWLLYRKPPRYRMADLWHTELSRFRLKREAQFGDARVVLREAPLHVAAALSAGRQWASQRRRPPGPIEHPAGTPLDLALRRCLELDSSAAGL
jgi:glycosyltransferase involved in cell wall biosynthesis